MAVFEYVRNTLVEGLRKTARALHHAGHNPPTPPPLQPLAVSAAFAVARLPLPLDAAFGAVARGADAVTPDTETADAVLDAGTVGGGIALLGLVSLLVFRGFRRFPTAGAVPEKAFASNRVLRGRVAAVGDGDNLRVYHQPFLLRACVGPWIPDTKGKLTTETIAIRLAGVDAPEAPHFGRPGQPYAEEARVWLENYTLGREVDVKLLKRDQYGRALASVKVNRLSLPSRLIPPFPLPSFLTPWASLLSWRKDVSLALVEAGFGDIYTSGGADHDGALKVLERAKAKAKRSRIGMWRQGSAYESPMAFKARHSSSSDS